MLACVTGKILGTIETIACREMVPVLPHLDKRDSKVSASECVLDPDGVRNVEADEPLRQAGAWMKVNGEGIRGNPFRGSWQSRPDR